MSRNSQGEVFTSMIQDATVCSLLWTCKNFDPVAMPIHVLQLENQTAAINKAPVDVDLNSSWFTLEINGDDASWATAELSFYDAHKIAFSPQLHREHLDGPADQWRIDAHQWMECKVIRMRYFHHLQCLLLHPHCIFCQLNGISIDEELSEIIIRGVILRSDKDVDLVSVPR